MKNEKKLLVAGTRTNKNYEQLKQELDEYTKSVTQVTIVTGCAQGTDALARRYAAERGLKLEVYKADWHTHGKSAGPKRNTKLVENAHAALIVWDGVSRGTADTLRKARAKGLSPLKVIRVHQ